MRDADIKLYVLTMSFHAHNGQDGHELELRICSGIHEGARLPLEPGRWRMGSGADADVILTDAGLQAQHVVLTVDAAGLITLESHQDHPSASPQEILPGQVHLAGPVRWSINTPQAPWPSVTTPVAQTQVPAQESIAATTPEPKVASAPAALVAEPSPSGQAPNSRPVDTTALAWTDPPRSQASRWVGLGLLLTLALGTAWWMWARSAMGPGAEAPRAQEVAQATATPQVAPAALVDAVHEAALAGRVHLSPQTNGKDGWVVTAYFLQDDELESLAERLSRLTPRPALRVLSENDVLLAAQDALQEFSPERPLRLRAGAPGEFKLEGDVPDRPLADRLIRQLAERFPEVARWHDNTRTPQDHGLALLEALKATGLGQIEGRWSPQGLQLVARLAPDELPQWEQLLTELGRKFGAQVPFKATVITTPAPAPRTLPAPFQIQSVVSGELPYVVLTDGRKLVVGASVAGFRLAEITPEAVRFDGPRTLVLQR